MRITKKKITAVAAGAAVVTLGASAAFAYWSSTSEATGSTTLASDLDAVNATFHFASSPALRPGGSIQISSVDVTNTNNSPVTVTGFGMPTFEDVNGTGCDMSAFSLDMGSTPASINLPLSANQSITGFDVSSFGIQLEMANLTTDQNNCKNAEIKVHVPVNFQS
jgi:hypothetical protein